LFQLSAEEARIIVRTFLAVFPHATLWRGDFSPTEPAIALVGGDSTFALNPVVIRQRLAELRADSANPHLVDPAIAWMHFLGMLDAQSLSAGEKHLNRDDFPVVELLGPLHRRQNGDQAWLNSRQLPAWLKELSPVNEAAWPNLSPEERAGVQAGGVFAEMVLNISERNANGAGAAQDRLRELLLPESFHRLFP
jgi:hypothetical protein